MHKAISYWSIEHGLEATDSVENAQGEAFKANVQLQLSYYDSFVYEDPP